MPHEMLYEHQRNYFNYYNDNSFHGGGPSLNVTSVRWQSGHGGFRPLGLSNGFVAKAQYEIAKHRYCLGGDCDLGGKIGEKLGGIGAGGGIRGNVGGRLRGRCATGLCN